MIIEDGVLIKVSKSEIKHGKFEIPAGVTTIGKSAFKDCGELRSIKIPKGVQHIDERSFL